MKIAIIVLQYDLSQRGNTISFMALDQNCKIRKILIVAKSFINLMQSHSLDLVKQPENLNMQIKLLIEPYEKQKQYGETSLTDTRQCKGDTKQTMIIYIAIHDTFVISNQCKIFNICTWFEIHQEGKQNWMYILPHV